MRRRKGGTVTSIVFLIVFVIIFLTVLQHIFPLFILDGVASSGGTSSSQTTRGSCTVEEDSGPPPAATMQVGASDALLASPYVVSLPYTRASSADAELANDSWWREVLGSSASTFEGMPAGLYWGFLNNSQSMKDWILQNVNDPPSWATSGVLGAADELVAAIESNATASGNATLAKESVQGFVLSLSGADLAFTDFLTAGSLSALKTYQETHDPYLALCQTFPGQMAQLFANSFNPAIPADERARYFGELLAVGSLSAVMAGHDNFDGKFKAALENVGLLDSWPEVKAYLSDVATKVSSNAAGLTLQAATKVGQNFPSVRWAGGYTAFRIDSMVDVLHDAGEPNDFVQRQLSELVRAADGSGDPEAVGDAADGVSYDDGHAIRLYITNENRGYLYTDASTAHQIKASFLEGRVPGFKAGQPAFLRVTYEEAKATVYHYYTGGDSWNPQVPDGIAKQGDIVTISIQILTRDDFVNSIPPMDLVNDKGVPYVGTLTRMTDHTLAGDQFTMHFTEDPPVEMNMQFAITGELAQSMGWNGMSGPYLDLHVTPDVFNDQETMRLYHDGYNPPSLGLIRGGGFDDVYDIASDGVRLRIVYSDSGLRTTTLYPVYRPSVLYATTVMVPYDLPYDVTGYSQSFIINNVGTTRILEHQMAYEGGTNDVGRIGAEIAYTVTTQKLGLENVVMQDPSEGGADLYTPGHKVVIESRMLQRTIGESGAALNNDITEQLNDMVARLKSDFHYYEEQGSRPTAGYAVFTYIVDQNTIKTIVLEVLPQ